MSRYKRQWKKYNYKKTKTVTCQAESVNLADPKIIHTKHVHIHALSGQSVRTVCT